ncbi:hypothetical protein [Aquisphaera insulae]|uniref:hypothetical protein n=1 Tax=Aquisphaera insulae TaxID=2712864 RepID=UPI0013EA4B6F|nr:hypothetical protein [Aquisphaera insulae]
MNPNRPDRRDVEDLVRDHLLARERAVDAHAMLDAVTARRTSEPRRSPPRRRPRPGARWAAAVAASLLIVGFAWRFHQPSLHADAVALVREAMRALEASPRDRAYGIRIDFAPGGAERHPLLSAFAAHDLRLHTRSDRFWIEARRGDRTWSFGRDEGRHSWLAPGPDVGLDFEPGDIPEPLDEALDLLNLRLDSVLHLLADDFEIRGVGPAAGGGPGRRRILGTPRVTAARPHPRLSSIAMEIDEATRTVREVVLSRVGEGRPVADITFRLEDDEPQPDAAYRLATHLAGSATILDHDRRPSRRRALLRFLGSLLVEDL